jgi:hypothetical protein
MGDNVRTSPRNSLKDGPNKDAPNNRDTRDSYSTRLCDPAVGILSSHVDVSVKLAIVQDLLENIEQLQSAEYNENLKLLIPVFILQLSCADQSLLVSLFY